MGELQERAQPLWSELRPSSSRCMRHRRIRTLERRRAAGHPRTRRPIQERLERSAAGRRLISAFLTATLASILVTNLPSSELRKQASRLADPYLNATGLDQNWGVFAPDPRREVLALEGRVVYADGRSGVWRPPQSGPLIGAYRDYRWRKLLENAESDSYRELWRPTAAFAARELERDGGRSRVASVSLVRRFYKLRPPGKHPGRGPWHEVHYHEQDVNEHVRGSVDRR